MSVVYVDYAYHPRRARDPPRERSSKNESVLLVYLVIYIYIYTAGWELWQDGAGEGRGGDSRGQRLPHARTATRTTARPPELLNY